MLKNFKACPFQNRTLKKIVIAFVISLFYHFIFVTTYKKFYSPYKTNRSERIVNVDDLNTTNAIKQDFDAERHKQIGETDNLKNNGYQRIKEYDGVGKENLNWELLLKEGQFGERARKKLQDSKHIVKDYLQYQKMLDRDYVQHYGRLIEPRTVQYYGH